MTRRSVLRRWLLPVFCGGLGLLGGFVSFHSGWKRAPALTDGSPAAFQKKAQQIADGDLLTDASPKERVGWLLETCKQPSSLRRDHALYDAIQHLQPGDFLAAIADLQELAKELTAMNGAVREAVIGECM